MPDPQPVSAVQVSAVQAPAGYGVNMNQPPAQMDARLAIDLQLQQCCSINQITPFCQPLCSYTVTKQQIFSKAGTGQCAVRDAAIWVRCASGGHENVACCHAKGECVCAAHTCTG
jgi:hypothetical protein